MEIEKLKEIVDNYNPSNETNANNYASLLAVEQILKNKQKVFKNTLYYI